MEGSRDSQDVQKIPEVTFSIEVRASTSTQQEAGRRLFSKLINRSQYIIDKTDATVHGRRRAAQRSCHHSAPEPTIRGADFTGKTENTQEKI